MAGTYDVRKKPTGNTKKTVLDATGYIVETFTETYTILIDANNGDDAQTVELGSQSAGSPQPLPKPGDSHPNKLNATVDTVSTDQKSVLYFESTVTYKTPSYEQGSGNENESPVNLPSKVRVFTGYADREIDYDYNGDPLENPETREQYSLITEQADFGIHITKNLASLDLLVWRAYIDRVNSDQFLGFSPGQARLYSLEAETAQHEGQSYWVVQAQILFRESVAGDDPTKAWYQRVIRKGLEAMTTDATPKKYRIGLNSDGEYGNAETAGYTAVQTRVLLNEDDEILEDGADPVFDLKQHKGTISFASLGFF